MAWNQLAALLEKRGMGVRTSFFGIESWATACNDIEDRDPVEVYEILFGKDAAFEYSRMMNHERHLCRSSQCNGNCRSSYGFGCIDGISIVPVFCQINWIRDRRYSGRFTNDGGYKANRECCLGIKEYKRKDSAYSHCDFECLCLSQHHGLDKYCKCEPSVPQYIPSN